LLLATLLVANNMIGSGFFLLPASLASQGSVTVLSWLVGTVLAVVLGGAFARLARDYPRLNCPDDYVRPALGRDMGFLATTLYWAASWAGNNAIAVAAFGYLVLLLPLDGDDTSVRLAGQLVLIWLMLAINLAGPRKVAAFQSFCVVFGLLPVAAVLAGGWTSFDPDMFLASWNVTEGSDLAIVLGNLAPVFWSFIGLETGAMVAGIVRDPDRNVPRATFGGIVMAGTVYLVSSVLVMGIVPAAELAASGAPFALVAAAVFGPWAALVIAGAAALKAIGTLGGWLLVAGESGARAADRGYLPAVFGRLLGNGAAGWGQLIVTLAMSGIAFLTLAPTVAGQFESIIGMVVLLVVMAYVAAGLSLMVGTPDRPSRLGDKLLGLGALLACGLLFYASGWSTVGGALAVALVSWILFRIFARPRA
jgi:arginine:agmatine antiporter